MRMGAFSISDCEFAIADLAGSMRNPLPDDATLSLFQKSGVIPHHQVTVDLLHQIEGNAHSDQQARSTVEVCNNVINAE